MLTIGVGAPYEVERDLEWACPVVIDGLYTKLAAQHGIDSWQSMQLAYQLILHLLGHFVAGGGALFWPDPREPVLVSELAPSLPVHGKVEG